MVACTDGHLLCESALAGLRAGVDADVAEHGEVTALRRLEAVEKIAGGWGNLALVAYVRAQQLDLVERYA